MWKNSDAPTAGEENPTFKIKRYKGPYKSDEADKDDVVKQSLNQDFSYFINKDVKLRQAYATLRHLAIILFVCAVLSVVVAIADIELAREARLLVSTQLGCEDTYINGWSRYCPPLTDGINFTLGSRTDEPPQTYFDRWLYSNLRIAFNHTVAGICLKSFLTLLTIITAFCLIGYHQAELSVLRLKRYMPEDSSFSKSPKLKSFCFKFLLACLHVPPACDAWLEYEFQLIVLVRLMICGIKILKECNELRYHRLGNVLSNLARVKIHSTFLIKTYFLRYPKTILLVVYLIVVGFFPYFVVITENVEDHQIAYLDACWLMVVTITNLGSGEVRPRGIPARIVVGLGSMIGILSTALWVNVFSKYLDLPNEERRILTIVEHQRCRRIERNTAAACIQAAWRRYIFLEKLGTRRASKRFVADRICKKAMWEWKCVRQNCNEIRRNLESNFSTEDTLIVARHMARRMSETRSKPLIVNKTSISKLTWDRKESSPFISLITNKVKPVQGIKRGWEKVHGPSRSESDSENEEPSPTEEIQDKKRPNSPSEKTCGLETLQRLVKEVARLTRRIEQEQQRTKSFHDSTLKQMDRLVKVVTKLSLNCEEQNIS